MAYVKAPIPSEVYHLTKKANLESILDDGAIRRFDDTECWFCESLAKMKAYMEQTVLCEGKPYYGAGGQLCRYPKFEPDEHIILKLTPCRREGNWYATVTFDGMFKVHGVRLAESKQGLNIFMPQKAFNKNGKTLYTDVFHPITSGARTALKEAVIDAYRKAAK